MNKGLIDISWNQDAIAIRLLNLIKFQCAKDSEWNTITLRFGVWRLYASISFTYSTEKSFRHHGIS